MTKNVQHTYLYIREKIFPPKANAHNAKKGKNPKYNKIKTKDIINKDEE